MDDARIVVGMSGGVDSAVAAFLLKEKYSDIVGVFMNNWKETDNGICTTEQDYDDVRSVCAMLDIPYYTVDFSGEYMDRVFSHFLYEYKNGRTPNPDILCNREIKFKSFLKFAEKLGAKKIATGHYARIDESGGKFRLLKARDKSKDQSYFLCELGQDALSRTVFPLGETEKTEVRDIAASQGFVNATKKDSTGICFIGERNFRSFLSQYLPAQNGDIYSTGGELVGRHSGLMYYTLGQRKGLGIGGKGSGEPWFVVRKDLEANRLIVQQGKDSTLLYSSALVTESFNWISGEAPEKVDFECTAKFRYRQPDQQVRVRRNGDRLEIEFLQKQRAVTPGQYAVLYDGEICLGGGVIKEVML